MKENQAIRLTTEALFDSHFRKQIHFGPAKEDVATKVKAAIDRHEPIILVGLMFTRKNICPLKSGTGNESYADFAEVASLVHLNNFARLISQFHPEGCRFVVLSEGTRFIEAFDLCIPLVRLYQKRLRMIAEMLHLNHLEIYDYEDFLSAHLTPDEIEKREDKYKKAKQEYEEKILPLFNPHDFERTLEKARHVDPIMDLRNPKGNFVPLWESIKNSIPYPNLKTVAKQRGIAYTELYREVMRNLFNRRDDPILEGLRTYVLRRSLEKAIEHNARVLGDTMTGIDPAECLSTSAFRTSINPKPGKHLGILSIRETTTRVQPWHGKAYVQTEASEKMTTTVLSRLEIEGIHKGTPIFVEGYERTPFLYADQDAVNKFAANSHIQFNTATR